MKKSPGLSFAIGLIPAGAGQTAINETPQQSGGAHPRGCGADVSDNQQAFRDLGSSPRVRGRRVSRGGDVL